MRRALPLLVWLAALMAGTALFHSLGSGPLEAPPLDPRSWGAWADGKDPLVATVAVLRLLVLALSWYLVGATTIGIVARLARAARLVRVADALTVPALRRLLQTALGLSLATTMVAAAVPGAGAGVAGGRPTMVAAAPEASASVPDAGPQPSMSGSAPVPSADDRPPSMARQDDSASETPDEGPPLPPMTRGHDIPPAMRLDAVTRRPEPAGSPTPAPPRPTTVDVPSASEARPRPLGLDLAEAAATDRETHDAVPEDALEPGDEPAPQDAGATEAPGRQDASATDDPARQDPGATASEPTAHTVVAGESLWTIARSTLAAHWGRAPSDGEVARYWHDLIDANRGWLADPDNPDLIFPAQTFTLPPVPDA